MNTIGQLNASIYRNMQILINKNLSDMDIKTGQYDFFLVISENEGLSQKELSEHLHIGKATTAKAVKHLIDKGYVYKEKDAVDGRLDHLYLTDLGKSKSPQVKEIFLKNLSVAAKYLNDKEKKQLLQLMNKVLNGLIEENNDDDNSNEINNEKINNNENAQIKSSSKEANK